MKTKILFFLALLLATLSAATQSNWQIVNPPVSENFTSLCFPSAGIGWIVSEEGTIISTSDNGISWQTFSYPEYHFESIHFSDENHGCVVGWNVNSSDSSFILMTSDGGNNWVEATHSNAEYLFDVFFVNNNIGWTVGFNYPSGWILYTDDAGISWTRQMTTLGVSGELYGVHFRDETHGHICGIWATFLSTNNGGTIGNGWAINISIPTLGKDLYSVYDFGELQGCAVGADGIVIYTFDNWANWIQINADITDTLWSVTNVEGTQHIWAVGNNGTIIHKPMYILPWEVQATNVIEKLNDVCMLSETDGWVVGDNGTILHFTDGVGIDDFATSENIIVFPVPTKDRIMIDFSGRTYLKAIQMINLSGELISEIHINQFTYHQEVDLSEINSGAYILNILTNKGLEHKKVVIY